MLLKLSPLPMVFALVLLAGCGPGGPPTYGLSGQVTYDGKPVPIGTVVLSPDASKDNKGPGASAGIKDGKYALEAGSGHGGGAYRIQVTGYDGVPVEGGEGMDPTGTELFPMYEMQADLPTEDSTLDIEVPAK